MQDCDYSENLDSNSRNRRQHPDEGGFAPHADEEPYSRQPTAAASGLLLIDTLLGWLTISSIFRRA
jgi:hypothetical protein